MTRRTGDLIVDSDFAVDMQKENIITITEKHPMESCIVLFTTLLT